MIRLGKIPKNIRITDFDMVPAKYFLTPRVMAAVRKEIVQDLRGGTKRTPPGVEVYWVNQNILDVVLSQLRSLKHKITRRRNSG